MKLILITWPEFLDKEAILISFLFEQGLDYLHLRKPGYSKGELRELLEAIPVQWHKQIVLHDHYDLLDEFALAGYHLNKRNSDKTNGKTPFSCSCHNLEEIEVYIDKTRQYLFLSPIFDSISKSGYPGNFTEDLLIKASIDGLLNEKIIALGGICKENIEDIKKYPFGGIALLGALWCPYLETNNMQTLKDSLCEFKKILEL